MPFPSLPLLAALLPSGCPSTTPSPEVPAPTTPEPSEYPKCHVIEESDKADRKLIVDYKSNYTEVREEPAESADAPHDTPWCGPSLSAYDFDKDGKVDAFARNDDKTSSLMIFDEKYRSRALEKTHSTSVTLSNKTNEKAAAQLFFDSGNNPGQRLREEFKAGLARNKVHVEDAYVMGSPGKKTVFEDANGSEYEVFLNRSAQNGRIFDEARPFPIDEATLFGHHQLGYSYVVYHFGADVMTPYQETLRALETQRIGR